MFGGSLLSELAGQARGKGSEGSAGGHCGLVRWSRTEQEVNVLVIITKAQSVQIINDFKAREIVVLTAQNSNGRNRGDIALSPDRRHRLGLPRVLGLLGYSTWSPTPTFDLQIIKAIIAAVCRSRMETRQ